MNNRMAKAPSHDPVAAKNPMTVRRIYPKTSRSGLYVTSHAGVPEARERPAPAGSTRRLPTPAGRAAEVPAATIAGPGPGPADAATGRLLDDLNRLETATGAGWGGLTATGTGSPTTESWYSPIVTSQALSTCRVVPSMAATRAWSGSRVTSTRATFGCERRRRWTFSTQLSQCRPLRV